MTYESALAAAWPSVALVGRAELRRFRLAPDVVEDLVQEAAAVVVRRRPDFSSGDDLAPYVRIVVRRLAYRWLRKEAREVVGTVPDRPMLHSVPELAEHRLKLRGTVHAFAELTPGERRRLRSYLVDETRVGDARERARERKQIERIRTAMNRVAEGFAAALGWVRMRLRWFDAAPSQAAGIAFALTGLVVAVLPHLPGEQQPSGDVPAVAMDASVQGASSQAAPRVGGGAQDVTAAPGPGAKPPRSAAPTRPPTPPTTTEVIRIDTPTGGDAGWRTRDNPTGNALVCVDMPELGDDPQCVEEVKLPLPRR